MIIYNNTKKGFQDDCLNGRLIPKLDEILSRRYRRVGNSEINSWRNSLSYMERVIADDDIPKDAGIAIEYVIPSSEKRIDFLISGYNQKNNANAVIVELKQWQHVEEVNLQNDMVRTFLGGSLRAQPHPSYQADSYASLLRDFNEAVQRQQISLHPCVYMHNYLLQKSDPLKAERYQDLLERAPVYTSTEAVDLRNYIKQFIRKGDASRVLQDIDMGRIRPAKSLQDTLNNMLQGNREFVMIDDQKIVYEQSIFLAKQSHHDGNKRVYIVQGGPGTGKSVVAINLLVELTSNDMVCHYITKNDAPRKVYKERLKGEFRNSSIGNLFKGSGAYYEADNNILDVAIVDESHRLNEKSGFYGNQGENQIKEIISSAKFSVFFIDEDQIISTKDIGTIDEIEKHAKALGAEIHYDALASQFRCNGSGGYIAWLDDVLDIRQTANAIFDLDYDIQIMDSPNDVYKWVKDKNLENNKARMLAGYCWEWPTKEKNNPEYSDIQIPEHKFEMSWNLVEDVWAISTDSVEQAGCIHTSQGLEFDYIGVIIGPDMMYENGIVTDLYKRAKSDQSIKGLKGLAKTNPNEAFSIADRIIKNTYRTLLSRGMKACRVYCTDEALSNYLKARLVNHSIVYNDATDMLLVSEEYAEYD